MDTGDWNEGGDSLAWRRLDEEIAELERRRTRREARFVNVRDEYALLACQNTRAYQRVFLGRWLGDPEWVLEGLRERIAHRTRWQPLMRYGYQVLGHREATMNRQWNLVADAVSSLMEFRSSNMNADEVRVALAILESAWGEHLPFPEPGGVDGADFTTYYRLRWMRLTGQRGWESASLRWLEALEAADEPDVPWVFAQHLPAEQIAAFHPDEAVRSRAATILSRSWLDEYDNPKSVLWVLRFRTLAAVALGSGEDVMPALQARASQFAETPLGAIAMRMVSGTPLDVVIRCPY